MSKLKRCTGCGEAKAPAAFTRDRHRRDGLTVQCRACRAMARSHDTRYEGHLSQVKANAALIAARLGFAPWGCERCPLRATCDGTSAALLPCELPDALAGVDVERLGEATYYQQGEPWLSETHEDLRTGDSEAA